MLRRLAASATTRSAGTALLFALACTATAQDAATGALNGVLTDAAGHAVAGASVAIENIGTHEVHRLQTDRLGEFLSLSLRPGEYLVTITANTFSPLHITGVTVSLGHTTRLQPHLPAGATAQQVNVRAEPAPPLDSIVSTDLSPSELTWLPLDGRRFQTLASLTPLLSAEDGDVVLNPGEETDDSAYGDSDTARLSARAQDPALNRLTLDGTDQTRHFDLSPRGGHTLAFTVPLEAVQEFAVSVVAPHNGDAHGRATGAAIRTITRRGGDAMHGSAFLLVRNSAANAANPFSVVTHFNNGAPTTALVKPRDQREQFGGSIGRRLLRGTYGFLAVEGQRRSFPAESTPSLPDFYQLSTIQTALLANRGVGAAAIARGLAYLDGLTGPVGRNADETAVTPRLDWDGVASHASLAWNHVSFQSPAGQNALPVVARGRGSIRGLSTDVDSVIASSTFAAKRWLLDAKAGYSRDATFAQTPKPLAQEPHTGPAGTVPEVDLTDAFAFGSGTAAGSRRLPDERVSEGSVKATFNGRAHTVSVGSSVALVDERIGAREASSGRYTYTSRTTAGRAGSLADFLTDFTYNAAAYPNGGCPSIYSQPHFFCFSSFVQSFGTVAETRFHTAEWSAFVADRWRVTPHLQLDAGVLYEWNRMPPAQHANAALDALFGAVASTGMMPSDTNNLAPHAGISYEPAQHTAVHVGYGYEFASVPGVLLQRMLENTAQPGSQTSLRLTSRTLIDPACSSFGTNFGYPATYACSPFGPVAAAGAAWMTARGFQMPAVQTAEVSVSQQVATRTTLSGSYVMALSRQLTNTVDLNVAPSTSRVVFRIVRAGGEAGVGGGEVFNVPRYTARRFAEFGPVTGVLSDGNGTYNALVLALQHISQTLTVRGSWTWSKSLDTVRSGATTRNEDDRFDPFQPLYDRAVSNFDHTHRVIFLGVWQPLLPLDQRWLRRVAAGWNLSPVLTLQSGRPYSYNLSGGTSLAGGRESLNGSGGANYLPTVGRNTLRLPWTQNVDVRASRAIPLRGQRVVLRVSAEAFNVLNHVNPTTVEQRAFLVGPAGVDGVVPLTFQDAATLQAEGLSGHAFGTPTVSANSVARERRLQAGIRIDW